MEKKIKIATLEKVLNYQNENVVHKFIENFNVSYEEASELFEETKKWLWVCAYRAIYNKNNSNAKKLPSWSVDNSMLILDEMWHTFILFTKDYLDFCTNYFGFFIHHSPRTKSEKEQFEKRAKEDRKALIQETKERTKIQYSFFYDTLGAETLKKWYITFPEKYTKEKICSLRVSV